MMFTVNRNPSVNDLRFFAWSMLIGFNGLAVLLLTIALWKSGRPLLNASPASLATCAALSVIGLSGFAVSLLSLGLARRLYVLWMTVTVPIGIVMSTILLTVLFVFLLPLFSLIVRLSDPLRTRTGGSTYWEDYKRYEATLERMRRPF